MKAFDKKFGADFVAELPTTPGVYLFKDEKGKVIYVGKAKNLRRRLSSYRNASRKKADKKMRSIVRKASTVEVRQVDTDADALVLENELIRTLRPKLNIEGKYDFLYPALGITRTKRHTLLCFTTDVDAFERFELRWYGVFRSRLRAKDAFESLHTLLALIGHADTKLGPRPRVRGSSLRAYRQVPEELVVDLESFLSGVGASFPRDLAMRLLEKPRARRDAVEVQEHLRILAAFFESDLAPLHDALRHGKREGTFVSQSERDTLFLRKRAG